MVSLIQERMAVTAEHQRQDTGSSSCQMVERGGVSHNKLGGAAADSEQSTNNGPMFWRCGKEGQRKCKGHNSSGDLAAIVPNGEPSVRVLGQEDVEANAHREEEITQKDCQLKHGTIDSPSAKGTSSKGKEETTERWR